MSFVPPVILLTDFGSSDPYVGQVKGVLHRAYPPCVCIDLFHDLTAFAVKSGAWMLERCLPYMPNPAVWLCVVDPGVGSRRRALLVQWGKSFFLGPDNGLLSPILRQDSVRVVALDTQAFPRGAATFDGRDLFALAATRILLGADMTELGEEISDPMQRHDSGWHRIDDTWLAEVMLVDHYGNLVTALPGEEVAGRQGFGWMEEQACGKLVKTFSSVSMGATALVIGGFGTVEVVVNQGSAAERFGCGYGGKLRFETVSSVVGR